MALFNKVLVANRGEIAVKVIETCKSMGIATVAVYSKVDKESMHVKLADESYCIGEAQSKKSYLSMEAILSVAMACGAEAIHPGYGFLSENYEFARLCEENEIRFIGPPSELIKQMGDKFLAKQLMDELGIPTVKGAYLGRDIDKIKLKAHEIGYPIMVKLRNGGGGRGIRIVRAAKDLEKAVVECVGEGKSCFNSEEIYIEKYINPASHIEVQILGDSYGNVVCFGERDCSVQIRNQKIIEETPCAKISPDKRSKLIEICILAMKQVGYVGCGTMEFLLDDEKNFYFMEMNCRLQVEYGVTELLTGVNLIRWQILIAAGEALSFTQSDVVFSGHAAECRINLSSNEGKSIVKELKIPEGVRFDTFLYKGYEIPVFYDALLGKLIVHSENRADTINKLKQTLKSFVIEGVSTNVAMHQKILKEENFKNATYNTDFMERLESGKKQYIGARERIKMLTDEESFKERSQDLISRDIIDFEGYEDKLQKSRETTGENEGLIYGTAKMARMDVVIFAMDGNFMMGSMGTVVGEKVTMAFELAIERRLPVIGVTVSGGARMQEGVLSLLQMVKTSAIVKKHSDKGGLYISVITHPTLGGVAASFASLSDIIIAEEGAVFGFSGRRIIEETLRKELPEDFQTAEYAMEHGMVDIVAPREEIRELLEKILKIHTGSGYGEME